MNRTTVHGSKNALAKKFQLDGHRVGLYSELFHALLMTVYIIIIFCILLLNSTTLMPSMPKPAMQP
uniref:Uncharacterized protein n=1 Tax=Rhizophora mucronata TaxID=61149 RepID=A0A2P2J2S4_RHIMU